MGGGPTVCRYVDCLAGDVVVLVLRGLFFQPVDEHLQIRLGDAANELIGRRVVQINHCVPRR